LNRVQVINTQRHSLVEKRASSQVIKIQVPRRMIHVAIRVTNMGTFLVIAKIKVIKVAMKVVLKAQTTKFLWLQLYTM